MVYSRIIRTITSIIPPNFFSLQKQEFIPTGPGGTVSGSCSESPYAAEPTCGWATAPDESGYNQAIPYVLSFEIAPHFSFPHLSRIFHYFSLLILPLYRDSQGFCCTCPTFGGYPIYRGYRSCSFSDSWQPWNIPGSAHCMRYDDYWWYRGYVIGTYQLDFNIQVFINITEIHQGNKITSPSPSPVSSLSYSQTISSPAPAAPARSPSSRVATIADASPPTVSSSTSNSSQEELQINPSRGFVINSDRSVSARLLGDLDSYRQIQSLDGHWVMIPVEPRVDPNLIYSQNEDMWVILPPTMVTLTGECNKVGVGYSAFRIQSEKCDQPLGSCLRNQLYDLGEKDNARVANGMEPLYNITRYGGGKQNIDQIKEGADNLSLRLPIKGIRTSLVTLEVKADDVQLVVNRAPGKILSSEVCTFDGVICGGFTAISGTGFLKCKVQNTGAVAAEFRAGILGCSGGVLPAVEEYATIAPAGIHDFSFDIRMESDQEGNRTCTVVVTDAAGDIADSTMVSFYTNATEYEPPPDQSDLDDKVRHNRNVGVVMQNLLKYLQSVGTEPNPPNLHVLFFPQTGTPGDPPNFDKCRKLCPNLFNIKCLIFKGCWKRLIQAASTIALIGGIIIVLAVAIKQGWMTRCIRILECCLPKNKKKVHRSEEIHRRNDGGRGPGQVSASGRSAGFKGEEPLEDGENDYDDEIISPANKKMKTTYSNGGLSFADAATSALAAKQWRHYQQQQLSLQQQQQQLQIELQQQEQQQHRKQVEMDNQLIGAYFDPTNSNINGGSTTSSPPYSPTPSQMMFYSPQASQGLPVPVPCIQPSSAPALTSSPRLTRAQTFQAHMFEPQQQRPDFSTPSPIRCWNSLTPNSPPPQYTAYTNPLSCQQQQQNDIEFNSNSPKHIPYAVGSPAAQFQREQQEQRDHQQEPVAPPPCWLVNAMGENDDVAVTIGPIASPSNLPRAFSKEETAATGTPAIVQPMQTEAPPPPPSTSGTCQDT